MAIQLISSTWDTLTTGQYTEENVGTVSSSINQDIRFGERSIHVVAIPLPLGTENEVYYEFNKIKALIYTGQSNGSFKITAYRYRYNNLNAINGGTLPYTKATGYNTSSNVDTYTWTYVTPASLTDGSLVKLGEASILASTTGEVVATGVKDFKYHAETFDFGSKISVLARQPNEVWSQYNYPSQVYLLLELRGIPSGTNGDYWNIATQTQSGITAYGRNAVGSSGFVNQFSNTLPVIKMISDLPVNLAPTDISLSATSIQENNSINAEIATITGTDPNAGDALSFSIPSGLGDDKFNVSQVSGAWKLRASVAFDYETATSHTVTIRTTDAGGLTYDKQFTITVLNSTSDDPPVIQNTVILGGKAVAAVSVDPRTTSVRVTISGVEQALPTGSVVKLSSTGQKFLKVSGNEFAFTAISVTPEAEWSWSAGTVDAWAILQSL